MTLCGPGATSRRVNAPWRAVVAWTVEPSMLTSAPSRNFPVDETMTLPVNVPSPAWARREVDERVRARAQRPRLSQGPMARPSGDEKRAGFDVIMGSVSVTKVCSRLSDGQRAPTNRYPDANPAKGMQRRGGRGVIESFESKLRTAGEIPASVAAVKYKKDTCPPWENSLFQVFFWRRCRILLGCGQREVADPNIPKRDG